jgi:AraC family transcriptional regulator
MRERTAAAHRDLAERATALIARSLAQPLSLPRLAERLRTSPFHLARVFRAQTGFSVDAYGRSLRLRAALERLPAYTDGLTALALELGFSSHSHFTEAFRREFGVAPSVLR